MRVIAGEARGTPLKGPRGGETRPTSDKVRGAMFDMLAAMGVPLGRVLDLYAGTGALGIEALSRGAEHADFVERNAAACAVIRDNLAKTKLAPRAHLLHSTVERALSRLHGPYDLVFLDPPYALAGVENIFDALVAAAVIDESSVVVYEHARRGAPPPCCGPLAIRTTRCHGDTCFTIYERRQEVTDNRQPG